MKPGTLNYVRRGSGEPLVLIHPLGAELVVWEPVMERLARDRDVIAVDLPGFGGSPGLHNGDAPTPQVLAGTVASLLDDIGVGRAHVAGNSLGGWVALELAKAGRALSVAGLCTAGLWSRPLGPRPGRDVRRVGRRLLPVLPAMLRSAKGRRVVLGGSVAHPERVPPAAAARLVRSYLTSTGYESADTAMRTAVFSGFEHIRVPVTLAWGDLDRVVRRPQQTLPEWRTIMLHGCGHIPTWDDPGQVARALLLAST
ncbi:MAG: alpha/beta fold hydrolase [Thermoleophilaceae bacterium]|nr:alpha/beta fold hydrolase [Thermoleophilaceae bacterium]